MAKQGVNRIEPQQTPVDLAIQDAGSMEALFQVAERNGHGITSDLIPGDEYIKPDVREISVVKVFTGEGRLPVYGSKPIKPASK